MGEVEVPQARIGSVTPPWIASLCAVRSSIRRAMPLLLGRKSLARPLRVGARFRVTDVNRPIRAKWNFVKHRPVEPGVIPFVPERWLRNAGFRFPVPVVIVPETPCRVSPSIHEIEKLRVCNHVFVDLKRRHVDGVAFEFVVPPEFV